MDLSGDFDILVDAMFGFSFHGNYANDVLIFLTVYTYKCLSSLRLLLSYFM